MAEGDARAHPAAAKPAAGLALADLVEAAGIGVWEYFPDEDRLVWSPATHDIFGVPPDRFTGDYGAFTGALAPEYRAVVDVEFENLARDGANTHEMRILRPDGAARWVRTFSRVLARDDAGRPARIVGTNQDITDLRAAGLRAEAAEARLTQAVRALPFGFVLHDAEDRLVMCNQPYLDMNPLTAAILRPGVTVETVMRHGLAAGEYPEAEGREAAWLAERLALHATGDNDFEQRREGGRWLRSITRRAPNGDTVGLRIDITEAKQLTRSLEESRRAAEAASEAKSRFLATMSHEIRTPLNGVLGMAELLSRKLSDPEHLAMLAVIRDSGRLLVSVINDVLDFSRLDAGKVTLEHAAFSPADLARQVGAVHAVAAAEKGLALTIDAAPAAGAARLGDAMRIAQVLHNLLGNAVKFTEAGAITLSVAADAAGATFTVRDQGIGMTADQAARVFDAFAQADSSITRRFGGAGLGLAIVKQLVDAMGGTIALDTAPQQGATFIAWLPLPLAENDGA